MSPRTTVIPVLLCLGAMNCAKEDFEEMAACDGTPVCDGGASFADGEASDVASTCFLEALRDGKPGRYTYDIQDTGGVGSRSIRYVFVIHDARKVTFAKQETIDSDETATKGPIFTDAETCSLHGAETFEKCLSDDLAYDDVTACASPEAWWGNCKPSEPRCG